MASSVDVAPSLGQGLMFLQEGPGQSPGYGAIDRRRMLLAAGAREGILHENAYKVAQTGGGDQTVTVNADAGMVNILGDSVSYQGIYTVGPHSTDIVVDIASNASGNPRNDLIVLEGLDDDHDSGGLNKARVRVITGTANASAAKTDALGANGTPTLPSSALPLAVVNLPSGDTVITDSQIDDRRYRTSGALSITAAEARTNTAYGTLTTPDEVRNVVLPAEGLLFVQFDALWIETVMDTARAAIFINGTQLQIMSGNAYAVTEAKTDTTGGALAYQRLWSVDGGLVSRGNNGTTTPSVPSTGAAMGSNSGTLVVAGADYSNSFPAGGATVIHGLAAGVYTVSVQYKSSSGTVTVKERKLRVWTQPFPG